jgi:putative salt-induced outer membrane protein
MNAKILFPPLLLLSTWCFAADNVPELGWSNSAELGAISTSGNTVGNSVTGKLDAHQELRNWSNEYILAGYFKDEEIKQASGARVRQRSAQRYSLSGKAAFKLLEDHNRLFALATHVDDRFGAYMRYSTLGVGYGTQAYASTASNMDVEIGPGYFRGSRSTGVTETGMTIRGAANLKWKVSESAQMSQNVIVERGTSNVHSQAETALRAKINGTMQMKAAYSIRNDTSVPADKRNTDTQTSLTLVYSF